MFKKKLIFPTALLTTASIFATASTGLAAQSPICEDVVGYNCTTGGYKGNPGDYNYPAPVNPKNNKKHNCTTYVAFKLSSYTTKNTKYNNLGDASEWATSASSPEIIALGVTVGHDAHVNDVAQWNFGHVAWVERVIYKNGQVHSIEITEDNKNLGSTVREIIPIDGTGPHEWPNHFITFPKKGSGTSDGGDSGGSTGGGTGGGRPPGSKDLIPIESVAPPPADES